MTVEQNVGLAGLIAFSRFGLTDSAWRKQTATQMIADLNIKTPSAAQIVKFLSGGNQQKVVIAKWLALHLKVLIIDEPTRGIDVGAKAEIYQLMKDLTASGMAILMISSEMEEIIHTADRVLVMHEGNLAGQLSREDVSEEAIMHLAAGGAPVAGAA